MTPEELQRRVAAELLDKAGHDLNSARLLASEEAVNSMFFSQQAAEKSRQSLPHRARRCIPKDA
jgi:HEPN domain-containing protein